MLQARFWQYWVRGENIQKRPTDFGPAETEVDVRTGTFTVTAEVKNELLEGRKK